MNNSNESPTSVAVTPRSLWKRIATSEGLWFVLIVATAAHYLYSHLGFNPTDEGYLLSGSRRLLDGQVPFRDYLSLRPVGTHFLHAHLVLWAGDRFLWWSRFEAWVQYAVVAWLWVRIVERTWQPWPNKTSRFAVAFLAFAACAHIFPVMPWNTLDGVFFMTLGAAVRFLAPARWHWLAYLLVGCSPLFRQNFVLSLPLLVLAMGARLQWRFWAAALVPGIAFSLYLMVTGAFEDAFLQMTSHKSSLGEAVLPSRLGMSPESFAIGLGLGLFGIAVALFARSPRVKWLAVLSFLGSLALATVCLVFKSRAHGWLLFGTMLAVLPFLFTTRESRWRSALVAFVIAWGTAISEGWPTPALVSGALLVIIAALTVAVLPRRPVLSASKWIAAGSVALALVMAIGFHRGRTERLYFERPARDLRYDLTGVFPGARSIKTNENTYRFLLDLKECIDWLRRQAPPGTGVGIVPEIAQFWVTSPQPNPLRSDWCIDPELVDPKARAALIADIEKARGKFWFIVQKHQARNLPDRLLAFQEGESVSRDTIRREWRKVHETPFFEIYE